MVLSWSKGARWRKYYTVRMGRESCSVLCVFSRYNSLHPWNIFVWPRIKALQEKLCVCFTHKIRLFTFHQLAKFAPSFRNRPNAQNTKCHTESKEHLHWYWVKLSVSSFGVQQIIDSVVSIQHEEIVWDVHSTWLSMALGSFQDVGILCRWTSSRFGHTFGYMVWVLPCNPQN